VFLWWQGGVGDDDRLLRELAVMANRLVLDSDETGLDAVERVVAYAPGIADLAWRRTAPWREAIAALFDGRRQRRQLDHLLGVEVRGPANEARLLAGWLRARLGREVGLDHAARTKRLNQVELHCGDEVFMVRRLKRDEHGVATGPGLADHVVLLPVPDRGRLLAAELDQLGAERTFEEALAAA
jgi:glucose-6-phosphate dehydrogenase assembly protein OpcA